jgi:hypothetical protein
LKRYGGFKIKFLRNPKQEDINTYMLTVKREAQKNEKLLVLFVFYVGIGMVKDN